MEEVTSELNIRCSPGGQWRDSIPTRGNSLEVNLEEGESKLSSKDYKYSQEHWKGEGQE